MKLWLLEAMLRVVTMMFERLFDDRAVDEALTDIDSLRG